MENTRDVRHCHLTHQRIRRFYIALAVIVTLISVSGSAFGQDGEILTPLMIAAKNGNVAAVRALTVLQIGVNAQTISTEIRFHGTPMEGRTALMFAAQEGHLARRKGMPRPPPSEAVFRGSRIAKRIAVILVNQA